MGISTTRYNGTDESAPPGLMSPEQLADYLGIGRTFAEPGCIGSDNGFPER
jgi:hypothetical protein